MNHRTGTFAAGFCRTTSSDDGSEMWARTFNRVVR
jgi:hypothetical protein